MISIKEACRYANFLDGVISNLKNDVRYAGVTLFKIHETHQKSKAVKDCEDEEFDKTPESKYEARANDIVYLINDLIKDKLRLSIAINKAKEKTLIDWKEDGEQLNIDSAVEYNKNLRDHATGVLSSLKREKNSESEKKGIMYVANAEGNQVQYYYTVKEVRTVDFDKDAVEKLYKKILKDADVISEMIDEAKLAKSVDYTPTYNYHDSLEDIVEKYVGKNK